MHGDDRREQVARRHVLEQHRADARRVRAGHERRRCAVEQQHRGSRRVLAAHLGEQRERAVARNDSAHEHDVDMRHAFAGVLAVRRAPTTSNSGAWPSNASRPCANTGRRSITRSRMRGASRAAGAFHQRCAQRYDVGDCPVLLRNQREKWPRSSKPTVFADRIDRVVRFRQEPLRVLEPYRQQVRVRRARPSRRETAAAR